MIKLSKKGGYALKSVIFIARQNQLVKITDISKSEKISESLLRRIISDLESGGILETVKGRNGGVKLKKTPAKITVFDILKASGEELGITECTRGDFCDKIENCSTTDLLGDLQKGFNSLLKMYTLEKVMKRK